MDNKNRFEGRLGLLPARIWNKISKIDELKGRWTGGAHLNPHVLNRLKRYVLVTSSGASTRIEGAKLSDEQIDRFIKGLSIQKLKDRDTQEVKGYYEILSNILNSWEHIKFSENCIKHFHKELLKYSEKDKTHLGEYKKKENKVHAVDADGKTIGVVFDTTPAYKTPIEMQELTEWTQKAFNEKQHHPLLITGNFTVEFLAIHPFEDGNGRLSRILTNFLMLKSGYLFTPYISHEKIIEENKQGYYLSLRASRKTFKTQKQDIVPWLEFFFDVILAQSEKAVDLLSKENLETILSQKQLAVWNFIHTANEVTPGQITESTKIARPTVNQALDKLLKLDKIERMGLGRSTRYRVK